MGYVYYNPNPANKSVGDCVIRAISVLLNDTWSNVYADLSMQGALMYDMPNADSVWGEYLKGNGFSKHVLPNTCPQCYTIYNFIRDHPVGEYLVATGTHVVAVINGDFYDTSNSGNEMIVYYWKKEN